MDLKFSEKFFLQRSRVGERGVTWLPGWDATLRREGMWPRCTKKTKPVFRSLFWKLLLEILSLCLGGLLKYSNIYKTKLMLKNSPGTLYDEPRVEKMLCQYLNTWLPPALTQSIIYFNTSGAVQYTRHAKHRLLSYALTQRKRSLKLFLWN